MYLDGCSKSKDTISGKSRVSVLITPATYSFHRALKPKDLKLFPLTSKFRETTYVFCFGRQGWNYLFCHHRFWITFSAHSCSLYSHRHSNSLCLWQRVNSRKEAQAVSHSRTSNQILLPATCFDFWHSHHQEIKNVQEERYFKYNPL